MNDIKHELEQKILQALDVAFAEDLSATDPQLKVTTQPDFGDYQANLAMSLARTLGKKPREIADEIVQHLDLDGVCEKVEIAGPGFINLYLSQEFIDARINSLARDSQLGLDKPAQASKIVLDYSAPNVAKEMHVGHLRSTVIGDAIARVLERLGHTVVRQNHMGDWGTQFGMLIEFLIDEGWNTGQSSTSIGEFEERYKAAKKKFDADEDFRERARNRVVALQGGDENTLRAWQFLVEESNRHFSDVYRRLGVLLEESDNCPESFYNPQLGDIVDELKRKGLLETSQGAEVVFLEGFVDREDKPLPMIVRKADGGFLYATTDLAAVRYRVNELKASRVIYVTDARQAQHFAMIFSAVKRAGWVKEGVELDHVPFGTVLGKDKKPFKTRDGGTIKLVDLLEEAQERARDVLLSKNQSLAESELESLSRIISVGALKYADLSGDRIKDYVFDWDRMLSLEGNTAPYLLNAYVRILSIFRKGEMELVDADAYSISVQHVAEKKLALKLFQYSDSVNSVAEKLEPHRLCTFLYELSSLFHAFYEACPILKDDVTEGTRKSRLALCRLTEKTIRDGLSLLGIETVEKM